MIPGSNLLNAALSIIAGQKVSYLKAIDRQLNDVGQYVTSYAPPTFIYGSLQPVSRALYEAYGLDFQKTYYNLYTSNNVVDLTRDISADQLVYNNQKYQVESANDWYTIDGWKGLLCVKIEDVVADPDIYGLGANNLNFTHGNFLPAGDTSNAG